MVNPFVKLTIAGGCVLGGVAFPPLLAGAGIGWGAVLATALGNVAAGNAANVVDALLAGGGKVSLENHDLTKAVGKAIAAVITLAALQHQGETGKSLQKIAAHAEKNWVKIAQQELTQQRYPALREAQLDQFLTPEDYHLTQEGNLKWQDWSDIFIRLNMATRKDGGFSLPSNLYEEVAKLLHQTFPQALRETLKEDFAQDGKAFAGLTLQLLTGMKAELAELRNTNPGATPAEYPKIEQRFQQLEAQLQGTAAQQQALFHKLSNEITSGFAQTCINTLFPGVAATNFSTLAKIIESCGILWTKFSGNPEGQLILQDYLASLKTQGPEWKLPRSEYDNPEVWLSQMKTRTGRQQLSQREYDNRQALLSQLKSRIETRLSQSLHRTVGQHFGREQQSDLGQVPRKATVKVGEQPTFQISSTTSILEVFDHQAIDGNLLILGKPGSGKTTTLLELAEALLNRASFDVAAPIPILVELSEWQPITTGMLWNQKKYEPVISQWLFSQIQPWGKHQIMGNHWPRETEFIFLCDGLDELPVERRSKCVEGLNHVLANGVNVVVCSSQENAQDKPETLQVKGTLYLEDLSSEEMEDYFARLNLQNFWSEIKQVEQIIKSINRPLFLNLISLVYKDLDINQWQKCDSDEQRLQYLLHTYQSVMLGNSLNQSGDHRPQNNYLNRRQKGLIIVGRYLSQVNPKFTAATIDVRPFLKLIGKQYQWYIFIVLLWTPLAYSLLSNLDIKLLTPFPPDSSSNILLDLLLYLLLGLLIIMEALVMLVGDFLTLLIEGLSNLLMGFPLLRLDLVWMKSSDLGSGLSLMMSKNPRKFWVNILKTSLLIGMLTLILPSVGIIWLLSSPQEYYGFKQILIVVLSVILLMSYTVILFLFKNNYIGYFRCKFETHFLEEMYVSLYTMIFTCVSGVILLILTLLTSWFILNQSNINYGDELPVMFLMALGLTFYFSIIWAGGSQWIKYRAFRLILGFSGQIPWNITRFLDYCTERKILQREGNRYRFIHPLVQEHFANLLLQNE